MLQDIWRVNSLWLGRQAIGLSHITMSSNPNCRLLSLVELGLLGLLATMHFVCLHQMPQLTEATMSRWSLLQRPGNVAILGSTKPGKHQCHNEACSNKQGISYRTF